MDRQYYLDLARSGLRMPIGADLTLHEEADPEAVRYDPVGLGKVVERTARRYRTPLAFPLMDLTLEKLYLLTYFDVPEEAADAWHFSAPPGTGHAAAIAAGQRPFPSRAAASHGAIRYIAQETDLFPAGMSIGPFSLMTKMVADPIAPVAMAGGGVTADEDAEVRVIEECLALAEAAIQCSVKAQAAAGARAVIVCEPAANKVYLSPRQQSAGSGILERFVLAPNRRLRDTLAACGVDLIFHDCGELTTEMVRQLAAELHPVILSLGSSRKLWEDAAVVPEDTVLFGNLPTKTFYSDDAMPVEEVRRRSAELTARMAECGHAHILGSECDVLYVPGAADSIRRKVEVMLDRTP